MINMDEVCVNTPKKQHYVPQFLLKNFSYGKKHKIFTFDKAKANSFGTSVKDSASENGFYNLNLDGKKYTLEHKLSKLESICSSLVKRICKEESLEGITYDDHIIICVFVANLLLRVKKQREFFYQLNTGITEWLQNLGLNPCEIENFEVLEKKDTDRQHVEFTNESVLEFSKRLFDKPIALLKAPNGSSLLISDNPVTIYNHWPQKLGGYKGVSVPGVEIQVPLSKKLCLSFICPFLFSDLKEKLDLLANHRLQNIHINNVDTSYAETLISSAIEGKAMELTKENVRFINSLQIIESLNYIYSDKNDFKLAEEMIKINPDLANGKVMKMGPSGIPQ
ncbi:DUF4238 domain-containing protein [Francisella philomiragia]|uniref:DUF4238 domain-containing protein n=1 Tax=Francisella philomiragia TaxID=28110 RepID=UPI001C9E02B3|nr:DUF4238 domain-containing protein [Francisella philomiragia]MBY7733436.1 DUF4238 domain-containing protein [Francisella philomiragia]